MALNLLPINILDIEKRSKKKIKMIYSTRETAREKILTAVEREWKEYKRMRKRVMTGILAAALLVGLTGCGSAKESTSADKKVLKVAMEGTYAPYTYHDEEGKLTGFEVDVANAIGEKTGYEIEFVEGEWDSLFAGLDNQSFDVIMNQVTITDVRKEKYDFSTPYIYTKPVLIVAADNEEVTSFDDVAGKKAAEGLTSNFSDIARNLGAEIVGQDKFALAMELVLSGEADLTINDELTYAYWKQQKGDTESSKIVAASDDVSCSAVVMNKGNEELLKVINDALAEMASDGTLTAISEKYFGMDITKE